MKNFHNKGKKCSIKWCDRTAVTKGMCGTHYQYKRTGRKIEIKKEKNKMCIVKECRKEAVGLGYCMRHYRQIKRHGKIINKNPVVRVDHSLDCIVKKCDRKQETLKGYCKRHWAQIRDLGKIREDLDGILNKDKICKEKGCQNRAHIRMMCRKHYSKYTESNIPLLYSGQEGEKKCLSSNCPRLARVKGYCKRHYYQVKQYGELTPELERKEYHARKTPLLYSGKIGERKCKAFDCQRLVRSKGYCQKHYCQVKRHGRIIL